MESKNLNQTQLRKLTGWSRRKASELVGGEMRYNGDVVNEGAFAMSIAPWELLMHPADANQVKTLLAAVDQAAVRKVAENSMEFRGESGDNDEPAAPSRKHG